MRYFALCVDFDGTLAHDGHVPDEAVAALKRVQASGRKLVLVTGRVLDELTEHFPEVGIFDLVVAENGAVLFNPRTREETLLAEAPPKAFVKELRKQGVDPMMMGRAVVATWTPHETAALNVIKEMGLDLHIIFNKGAVMILPASVSKATGLTAALAELGLSAHNAVGIGDAENDHAFLSICECSVAVANALDVVKKRVDHVTKGDHATGVIDLIELLIDNDLTELEGSLTRHHVLLGHDEEGSEVFLPSAGVSLLIAGSSGSGKSSAATGILERLAAKAYQFCIIDPEGDYAGFEGAVALGDKAHAPTPDEVLEVLERPQENVVVNMLSVPLEDRPEYFATLLPRLQELRSRTGRPHWIVVDEVHHVMPREREAASLTVPSDFSGVMLISVHPDLIAPAALQPITTLAILGKKPKEAIQAFVDTIGCSPPKMNGGKLAHREAIVWDRRTKKASLVKIERDVQHLKRHTRKYAEGDLGPDRSFYFTGPKDKMKIRAQNLMMFSQIGEGIDDDTWNHHLKQGDYSAWFRNEIKNSRLADRVAEIEKAMPAADESRRLVREAIEEDYTLPAGDSTGWESEDPEHQTVTR